MSNLKKVRRRILNDDHHVDSSRLVYREGEGRSELEYGTTFGKYDIKLTAVCLDNDEDHVYFICEKWPMNSKDKPKISQFTNYLKKSNKIKSMPLIDSKNLYFNWVKSPFNAKLVYDTPSGVFDPYVEQKLAYEWQRILFACKQYWR